MTTFLLYWAALKALDPRAPYLAIALLVGAVIQVWKLVHKKSFDAQPSRIKTLPAAMMGALLMAAANQNLNTIVIDVFFGAISGVTAVGGHETLRRLLAGEGQEQKAPPDDPLAVTVDVEEPKDEKKS